MAETWDVIVVGGGIIGSAAAYHCARQGLRTLLLEQFSAGHSRGSSGGETRIIRYLYPKDEYVNMLPESYDFWRRLEAEVKRPLLKEVGLLRVEGGEKLKLRSELQTIMSSNVSNRVSYEKLSSDEMGKRFPMFNFPDNCEGVLEHTACSMYATRCLQALQDMAGKYGAVIHENTRVDEVLPGAIVTVKTSGVMYRTKQIILCPGPWAKPLLQKVGLEVPLKSFPGLSCYWKAKNPSLHSCENRPMLLYEVPVTTQGNTAKGKTYQFIYSFPSMEHPGLVKVGTRGEPLIAPGDPETRNPGEDHRVIQNLRGWIQNLFSGLEDTPSHIEPCMYTVTPDHDYIISRHPAFSNIIVAAGMSGHGFKTAPVIGKLLMQLATNQPTSYDIKPYSLTRFKSVMSSRL